MAYILYNSRYPDYNAIASAYSDLPENEGVFIPRWGTVYRSALFVAQYNPNSGEFYGCITNTDRASVYFQNASFLQWTERTGNNHYAYEMVTSGWQWSTQTTVSQGVPDIPIFSDATEFVNYITTPAPPQYNWQSVPSISGKNGILQSLVQIKEEAINDGEPVSEATVLSFDSLGNINIPSVIDEQMPVDPSDVTSVTATYLIPALEDGTYEGIKLLVKKNSIPTSEEDADKVIDLSEPTSILRIDSKSVGNLDEDSHYYFMIKLVDEIGTEATSDPKDIWTSHSEGYNFPYSGEIVEWTVPKTGIYSLETWGAQGGEATDGTNSARGGYGAYAYGEVLLTQGDKLYINVGGQNGYGGGGNYTAPSNE